MFFSNLVDRARKERRKEAAKQVAVGLSIGAAAGAVAGLLLAPKTGRETRKLLADRTSDTIERLKENIEDARDRIEDVRLQVVESAKKGTKTETDLDELKEAQAETFEAVKDR